MSGLNQHPAKVSSVVIWTVGSNPTLNAKFERHIAWILPSQEALGPATCLSPKRFGCLRILWPAGWEVQWHVRVVVFKPKGRWQCVNGTRREVGGSRVWWKTNWWVKTCWPNFWCGTITTGVRRAYKNILTPFEMVPWSVGVIHLKGSIPECVSICFYVGVTRKAREQIANLFDAGSTPVTYSKF